MCAYQGVRNARFSDAFGAYKKGVLAWKMFIIATLNDCESPYPSLLVEAHQITFHQPCINSLMIEIYKYLNGHSPYEWYDMNGT